MSTQTTFRFFVNNERVATAVYWEKEKQVLEVYPLKRNQLTFASEEEWRKHCERDYSRKPVTRVEVTTTPKPTMADISLVVTPTRRYVPVKESVTYRFFVNDQRVSTAVFWELGNEHRTPILEVYPPQSQMVSPGRRLKPTYRSETEWRQIWSEKYTPRTYVEVTSAGKKSSYAPAFKAIDTPIIYKSVAVKEASTPKPKEHKWVCCICHLPPGNDHRMCIAQGYRWSKDPVGDWERDSGVRRQEPEPETHSNVGASSSSSTEVNPKDWTFKSKHKATFPAGKYYIGDLCYVLGEELYHKILIGLGDCEDGVFMKKGKEDTEFFMMGSTAYGDGIYLDDRRREYCVDAGLIGICPMTCINKDDGGGQYHTFNSPVTCKFSGGVFHFESNDKYICIDTSGNDDEECDCDNCADSIADGRQPNYKECELYEAPE